MANFDQYSEFYPRHSFAGTALRNGEIPLWDSHQIAGLPFLATYQGGVLYPPNLLYAILPTGLAMGLIGLLHVVAAGVFAFLLSRQFEYGRLASWLAGLIFMVGGSTLSLSSHPNALNSVPWLPAALYCTARLGRDGGVRWALLLGGTIALQFLAGREFTFVMTVHTVALYVVFQLVWMWRDGASLRLGCRHLTYLALGALVTAGLVAAQALPTLALSMASGRTTAGISGDFVELYGPTSPAFLVANLLHPLRGALRREYFGWIPLICFVVGFRLWGRDRAAVFASLLSLLALVLCLGSQTPVYAAYRALPLGAIFRLPDRFIFLLSLGVSLVAAGGLDQLLRIRGDLHQRLRALAPRGAVVVLLGLAVALVVESSWLEAGLAKAAEPWGWFTLYGLPRDHFVGIRWTLVYCGAAVSVLALAVSLNHTRWSRAPWIAILALAAADLGFALHNPFLHPANSPAPAQASSSCYEQVPAIAGELGRHLSFRLRGSAHALKDKDGELFARYSATHYEPLVTRRHVAYFAALQEGGSRFSQSPWSQRSLFMGFLLGAPAWDRAKLLDLLGVGVLLADARPNHRPNGVGAFLEHYRRVKRCRVLVGDRIIPVDLYANPNALARAFLVHRLTPVENADEAIRRLVEPDFDPRQEALVEALTQPVGFDSGAGTASVEIRSYESTRVVVQVETTKPGMLVLTDSYDPDWEASLGGHAVEIHPTNGLFRGVMVPAGRSEVVFRYRPHPFYWGAGISAATLALASILWIRAGTTRSVSEEPENYESS